MAGAGAGPSRRSHTKSRKGCKTCKRRHIRCDETFPQCRNCTKHQVRCDYMDIVGTDQEERSSPERGTILLSPESESHIEIWQQTGSFPFPLLQVYPSPQTHEYGKNDLRLIYHISSICNTLQTRSTSGLALWTAHMPKFLGVAATHPFVMQAILAFSANHLAWVTSSNETRNLYLHHASISLRGLHEAIGNFSQANADAVLAASLLLLWQATDWRSWTSLRDGIQSVVAAMQSWQYTSIFRDFLSQDDLLSSAFRGHRRQSSVSSEDRAAVLENVVFSLSRLQMSLLGHEREANWVAQLMGYIQHLQGLSATPPPEEQFNTMYRLRKWLFWIPIALLEEQDGQGPALLTLAHFYATALVLQPLFPDLGASFCAALASTPLESIISVTDVMQSEQGLMSNSTTELASMLHFPRQTVLSYRTRSLQEQQHLPSIPQPLQLADSNFNFGSLGNMSPAFAPSPMHYGGSSTPQPGTPSSAYSPYVDSTHTHSPATFTYGAQTWASGPSVAHPLQTFPIAEDQIYHYGPNTANNYHGGFVHHQAQIWT